MQNVRFDSSRLNEIQPLFRKVFGHDISLEFLDWKYGAGRGESWALIDEDNQLLLHCGVFYRNIALDGVHLCVAQLVDLMATPKRSGLSRGDSPFALLIREVLAQLQTGANPDALAFGFPSDRAMRLGERLGVFCAVDDWYELSFSAQPGGAFDQAPDIVHAIDPFHAKLIDRLWLSMSREFIDFPVGVRDAAYISQRYFQHPQHSYCCLLVRSRWFSRPVGVALLRGDGVTYELLDIVAPLSAMHDVVRSLQVWLYRKGGSVFNWHLTSRFANIFAPYAESCRQTEFRIMANPFSSPSALEKFDHKWWLTGGDTDYR